MPLLNKEKMMDGFGKAVDAVNNAADKSRPSTPKKKNWTRKLTMPQRLSPKRQKKLVKKSRVYFQARKNRRRGL